MRDLPNAPGGDTATLAADVTDEQAQRVPGRPRGDWHAPTSAGSALADPVVLPPTATHANARFMLAHPAHGIAMAFGAGLSPVAAGTVGTLWAWLVWVLLLAPLPPATQGAVIGVGLLLGCWAAAVTVRHLGHADPGAIVADEVIAFWIVLWLLLPAGLGVQLAAFLLFRFFDAVKPGPVGWADRLLHHARGWAGGFGVLFDDLVAAFCTLLVIALWRWW